MRFPFEVSFAEIQSVVQHQVHIEFRRHRPVDDFQELLELHRAMPPVALADHLPGCRVQGRVPSRW